MNTHTIGKAMIETAVKHGFKEMREDPKRSMRRLADLGRQFSKSRFQDDIFSVIQEVLQKEDSAYYTMIENALANINEESLETFGINVGYNAWVCGARSLRRDEIRTGHALPDTLLLRYDAGCTDGLTIPVLDQLIRQGSELGIFFYFIQETGTASDSYELLDLFQKYPECAFVYARSTGRLTAAQIQVLKMLHNTLILLPDEDPETLLTAQLLQDQKVLYSISFRYSGLEDCQRRFESAIQHALSLESTFFVGIADDSVERGEVDEIAKFCYQERLEQEYSSILIDYYGDTAALTRKIMGHGYLLELGADGSVLAPDTARGQKYTDQTDLSQFLRDVMPCIDVSGITEK